MQVRLRHRHPSLDSLSPWETESHDMKHTPAEEVAVQRWKEKRRVSTFGEWVLLSDVKKLAA